MADPDQKQRKGGPAIPQWQRKDCSEGLTAEKASSEAPSEKPSRASLLEQASRFLEDDDIRDASTDRKVAFLESKGLTNDEIDSLLGVSRNTEASASTSAAPTTSSGQQIEQKSPQEPSDPKSPLSPPGTAQIPPPSPPSQQKDVPPVITYPEFLAHAHRPPPLVTFRRLLNTFYAAAGTALTIYGANKYLVAPMREALTSARHDFASTTQSNLDNLNEKLEGVVSEVPPPRPTGQAKEGDAVASSSDAESDTSDPTELFHRDMGTQTSPPSLSPSARSPSSSPPSKPDTAIDTQTTALATLHTSLTSLLDSATDLTDSNLETTLRLQELTNYLNDISYSSPYYLGNGAFSGAGNGMAKDKDDLVNKVKAEIRGVKGVFLSAKNFPASSGPAARPGAIAR
ncbi:MAG: hypothetical protein M1819_002144 [Sarea resinae]|nr:MAG: hypothetical protein M1819_002144 [Sarea resinae]